MPPRVIKTDRLLLRPLELADATAVARLVGQFDVSRWLTAVPYPYSVEDAETFISDSDPDWRFGIEVEGNIAGLISIQTQFGFWLGKPYWGRGFMSEAAQAVIDEWFLSDGGTVYSGYFVDNRRSSAVLRKIGFRPAAIVQEHSLAKGKNVALQKMILTRQGWQARNG